MNNLEIYNKVRAVPKEALKDIQAGRLKGKSDINPMWRIQILTEQFGPCGVGWKYEIVKMWTEQGAEIKPGTHEISAFVQINLFYRKPCETAEFDTWSEPIPGIGGSAFIASERSGPYTSDECYKMALTDAISVACKALGVAADVYWDKDPTKYNTGRNPTDQPKPAQPKKPRLTKEQMSVWDALTAKFGDKAKDMLKTVAGVKGLSEIQNEKVPEILKVIEAYHA